MVFLYYLNIFVTMTTKQEIQNNLGSRLTEIRKRKKLSQKKLAEKANVSINTISELERGVKFTGADVLARLANCLEIEVSDLFIRENHMPFNYDHLKTEVKMTINGAVKECFKEFNTELPKKKSS